MLTTILIKPSVNKLFSIVLVINFFLFMLILDFTPKINCNENIIIRRRRGSKAEEKDSID